MLVYILVFAVVVLAALTIGFAFGYYTEKRRADYLERIHSDYMRPEGKTNAFD